ncbi:MAG: SMP-30/gluconolactonase/LRE family protein [Gemmataceae bacterium]
MRATGIAAALAFAATACAQEPIFEPGAILKVEAANGSGGEGPAWHPKLGLFTSGNGHVNLRSPDGQSRVYREGAGTNGLLLDRQGRLLACEPKLRRVTRTEADGTVTVLAERYQGKRFNQPNDLTLDSRNRLYFSDPCYGDRSKLEMTDEQGRIVEGVTYRIDPDNTLTRIIGRELERPNGVLVSRDDKWLYVADNNNTIPAARESSGASPCEPMVRSTKRLASCSTTGARAVGRTG